MAVSALECHDIPAIAENVEMLIGRVRHIADCVWDHHRTATRDGEVLDGERSLLLDIVEIHGNLSAIEDLLGEIRESAKEGGLGPKSEVSALAGALSSACGRSQ